MDLVAKMTALGVGMTQAERANYKFLLSLAAGGLVVDGQPPSRPGDRLAFTTAIKSIAQLQPHRHRVPPNGVVYLGRPAFVSEALLNDLRRESAELREKAERFDDHFVSPGGPIAQEVAFSEQLNDLVSTVADHVTPTARANYLYYDRDGLGIDPHIDNEAFSLNTILMLDHIYTQDPSRLVLYPPDQQPERILLAPGDLIVFYADSITHARERMDKDEVVRIAAFGFHPIVEAEATA